MSSIVTWLMWKWEPKETRELTFGDVLVRVKSTYILEMHIDTDEGNAADLERRDFGETGSNRRRSDPEPDRVTW